MYILVATIANVEIAAQTWTGDIAEGKKLFEKRYPHAFVKYTAAKV